MGMKKEKGKTFKSLLAAVFLITCVFLSSLQVYAAEAKVVSTIVSDGCVYIYIRGVSELGEGTGIQIGSVSCPKETIAVGPVSGMDIPMRTILLVDNSQSIPGKNREDIQTIAKGVINGGMEGEQFRIGTFSDQLTFLSEFTSEKETLNRALEEITYNNQDTYLSDILYEIISDLKTEGAYTFTRILIFSDGADDKAIGYTNDEVRRLIEKNPYPVYAVGIQGKNNSPKLEAMFSFSRAASSEYFLLDGTTSNEDIVQTFLKDQENLCIRIQPEPAVLDGSIKNILLKLNTPEGTTELVTSVEMPFGEGVVPETAQEIEAETESATEESQKETKTEPLPVLSPVAEQQKEEKTGMQGYLLGIAIAGLVVAAVVVICIVILRKRKKKEEVPDEDLDSITVMYKNETEEESFLVLKNLDRPESSFQIPVKEIIRIGRKDKDINLDDDRMVSHDHCDILIRQGVLYIKDNNSTNGTWYRGARVYEETQIANGDTVKIGKYSYSVEVVGAKEDRTMMYVENVQTDDAKSLW